MPIVHIVLALDSAFVKIIWPSRVHLETFSVVCWKKKQQNISDHILAWCTIFRPSTVYSSSRTNLSPYAGWVSLHTVWRVWNPWTYDHLEKGRHEFHATVLISQNMLEHFFEPSLVFLLFRVCEHLDILLAGKAVTSIYFWKLWL